MSVSSTYLRRVHPPPLRRSPNFFTPLYFGPLVRAEGGEEEIGRDLSGGEVGRSRSCLYDSLSASSVAWAPRPPARRCFASSSTSSRPSLSTSRIEDAWYIESSDTVSVSTAGCEREAGSRGGFGRRGPREDAGARGSTPEKRPGGGNYSDSFGGARARVRDGAEGDAGCRRGVGIHVVPRAGARPREAPGQGGRGAVQRGGGDGGGEIRVQGQMSVRRGHRRDWLARVARKLGAARGAGARGARIRPTDRDRPPRPRPRRRRV